MNEYNATFKIYANSPQQAQAISNLFINLLNTVTPEKLEQASKKVSQNPKVIGQLLKFI